MRAGAVVVALLLSSSPASASGDRACSTRIFDTGLPLSGGTITGNLNVTGDISVGATKRLYLDGGSNTYIFESSDGQIRMVMNGSTSYNFSPTAAAFGTSATQIVMPGIVRDISSSSCFTGDLVLDTGGATTEWCVCQPMNTWLCVAMTAGPTD